VTLGCVASVVGGRALGLDTYAPLAVAAVLFTAASRGVERLEGGSTRAGISLGGLLDSDATETDASPLGLVSLAQTLLRGIVPTLRELGIATALSLLIFPPFFVGYVAYWGLRGSVELRAPVELLGLALTQVVLVAIPEEAYFRGYLQTALTDAFPPERTLLGVAIPVRAIVVQALAFGLLHFVVDPNPARLAVFFPGLVFGLMRTVRSGIGAAVFFHVLCNLYAETLALSVR